MIDVIMCSYNSEETIAEAVKSVLSQTFKDFNLYVFDDNSQDKTLNILKRYTHDERLTVVSAKKNVGTYAGKNYILKNFCTSSYVALHDSDDYSEPTRFEKQVKHLQESYTACVGTAVREFWKDGEEPHTVSEFEAKNNERINMYPISLNREHLKIILPTLMDVDKYEQYIKFKFCMNGTVMIKRYILQELGGWDGRTRIAADTDLFIRILGLYKIDNLQESLYNRRFHKKSLTSSSAVGISSNVRREYNLDRKQVIINSLNKTPTKMDFYYPEFECEVIKCAE
jgi:glycosyltransferase involved in cell wall biosynthesis